MLYLARIKRSRSPVAEDPLNIGLSPGKLSHIIPPSYLHFGLNNVIVGSPAGNYRKTTKFCPCLVFLY